MHEQTLYQECPKCAQNPVVFQSGDGIYHCHNCGLTIKERSIMGIFRRGRYGITDLGEGDFKLAEQGLKNVSLSPDPLKVTIANIYSDQQLAEIANGALDIVRPVKTVLAEIILEQLNEATHLQINGLRRGHGPPISNGGHYHPVEPAPRREMAWQDEGNLFGTSHRLVFPSNTFTFIRMDRKVVGTQAFSNGVAIQRKGEDYATYFVGCFPHEAALVAAFTMAKIPALRKSQPVS